MVTLISSFTFLTLESFVKFFIRDVLRVAAAKKFILL